MISIAFLLPLCLWLSTATCQISNGNVIFPDAIELFAKSEQGSPVCGISAGNSPSFEQPPNTSVSAQCKEDVKFLVWSLTKEQPWALQMLDAYGKLPAGVLSGAFNWPGNFRQCRDFKVPPLIEDSSLQTDGFRGKYCSSQWQISPKPKTAIPLTIGLCIPDSCKANDVCHVVSELSRFADLFSWLIKLPVVYLADVQCQPTEATWDAVGIVSVCLLSLLGCVMMVGTTWDVVHSRQPQKEQGQVMNAIAENADTESAACSSTPKTSVSSMIPKEDANKEVKPEKSWTRVLREVLLCFSLYTNGKKLLDTSQASGQLTSLHGIRFLSMCWVILGHTYYFSLKVVDNPANILEDLNTFSFEAVLQGPLSVDTFFMLSGLLLTYLFMKEVTKSKGKINWFLFYFHRWWRLSPVYYILMLAYIGLLKHTTGGPFWPYEGVDYAVCTKYWWRNILYINNVNSTESCMGWSWYMANDMQFYVISPLFLWPMWRWPVVGLLVAGALLVTSWIATFIISYQHNFLPLLAGLKDVTLWTYAGYQARQANFFDAIYVKPYCRIAAYIIGVYLGYALYKAEEKNIRVPRVSRAIFWFLSTGLCLATVYGLYDADMGKVGNAFFNALSRTAFIIGVSWVVFACIRGYGGFINSFLSWKFWIPLSRLTYCAYLVHPMIMYWSYFGRKEPLNFSHDDMVRNYLGFLVMAYSLAMVASLALEAPMMRLEKLIFRFERKKPAGDAK